MVKQNQEEAGEDRGHGGRRKSRPRSSLRPWTNTSNLPPPSSPDDPNRLYQTFETRVPEKKPKAPYQPGPGISKEEWNEIKKLGRFIGPELTGAGRPGKKDQEEPAEVEIHMHRSSSLPLQYDDERRHRTNKSRSTIKLKSLERTSITKPAEEGNRLKVPRLEPSSSNTSSQEKLRPKLKRWKQWTPESKPTPPSAKEKRLEQKNEFLKELIGRLTTAVWDVDQAIQDQAPPLLQQQWVAMNKKINAILDEVDQARDN